MRVHVRGVFQRPEKFVHMPLSFVGNSNSELARWVKVEDARWPSNDASFGLQRVRVRKMELVT